MKAAVFYGDGIHDDTEALRALVGGKRDVVDARGFLLNPCRDDVHIENRDIRLTGTVVVPDKPMRFAVVMCDIRTTAPRAFAFERYDRRRHAIIRNVIVSSQTDPDPVGDENYYFVATDSLRA